MGNGCTPRFIPIWLPAILIAVGAAAQQVGEITGAIAGGDQDASATTPTLQNADQVFDLIDSKGVAGLREARSQLGITGSTFADHDDSTSLIVARGSADVDGDGASEAILTISDSDVTESEIMVLTTGSKDVSVLGTIEIYNQHQRVPTWRVEQIDDSHRWLVVRTIAGSGNGFEHMIDTWHSVDPDSGLSQVLEYSADGHVSGHDLAFNRSFDSDAPRPWLDGGTIVIDIHITAIYTGGSRFEIEDVDQLFSRSGNVRYIFDEESGSFTIDESKSDWTEAEVAGVFSDDEQGFLQHNLPQLKELATTGSEAQREWVRQFLTLCDDSTEKDLLTAALGDEAE